MARLYTADYGLPNSQVNDIYQDGRGFIWISTENGLARFDGADFQTFRFIRGKDDALASDLVLNVFEDSREVMWVGTSMGLQIFDPDFRSFRRQDLGDPNSPGSTQHISSIAEIKVGSGTSEIWAATSQHGIYIMDIDSHNLKNTRRDILNQNLPSPFVYTIFQDSRGWVWLAGETGGLSVVNSLTMRRQDVSIDPDTNIRTFCEDPETGNVIIGTMQGIYVYEAARGILRRSSDKAARKCQIFSIIPNSNGQRVGERTFLVGTEANGLKIYDMDKDELRDPYLPNVSQDISHWKIHSLIQDNQGNVWLGAFQTGLMVIPRSMYGFEYLPVEQGCVTSIVRDPHDGALWIGTDGGGLLKVNGNSAATIYNADNSPLTNDSVMALAYDGQGRLWIATYLDGLFTYTPSTGIRRFADNASIESSSVVCLAYDEDNKLLYAGTYGAGMSIIDPKAEKVVRRVSQDINKWVSALYIDRSGMVWLGTYNGPLCYNHSLGKLITYNVGDNAIQTRVYCFNEAADGRIWIGTGEGLTACDRTRGTVKYYSEADGLPSNVIDAILEAEDGTIWVSTSYGLSRLDPVHSVFTNYYSYDGLQSNEFHFGAAMRDTDGQLLFGGTGGITKFHPQVVNQMRHPVPPLYFSRLTVLNEDVDYDAHSEINILDKHITEATKIDLPHNRNTFSLEFAVLEYTNPRKIRYAYKLNHFDQDWHYISIPGHSASYSNLPSGKYTLNVKAYFDGSMDECATGSIDIHVRAPWYLSGWAFLGYALLFCGLLMLLRAYLARRRQHSLDREASDIKELKLRMFTNISHEIRTPLTLVMSPLKQMREAETDPHKKGLYNLMYRNSLRIMRLVNQLMDMRKVDEGQMQLHFLETDIVYFIRDIMQSFDNMAVSRKIDLSLKTEAEVINLWIDQGNFDKIIFNLLSNAFKHTPDGGRITIDVSLPEKNRGALPAEIAQQVRIGITNSGSHIEDTNLERVFDRFFQTDVLDAKIGSGVGLSLTRMLVELHHGRISASNTDDGVCFNLLIPVGCEHLSETEMSKTSHHKDLYVKTPEAEELDRTTEDIAFTPEAVASDKLVKSRRTVIIVDDDEEICEYLLNELKPLYNVKTFPGAAEAWADISTSQPDVVVTDLRMPGMDGLELCRRIKHSPVTNHIPVIILTSSSDEASQLESIENGADRFLSKPLSVDILKSSIAQVISTRDTIRGKYSNENKYDYDEVKLSSAYGQLVDKVMEVIKA
ncbi:MAG: response regulator, partial [Bacteroidales bacterium]|nr:response regulator [Bacteroidales bacterium]